MIYDTLSMYCTKIALKTILEKIKLKNFHPPNIPVSPHPQAKNPV